MNTAPSLSYDASKLPPMLTQYLEYKAKYPDALLLFQVGDFYETFFEDAVTISRAINLTLTSRDKNSAKPIPMAGVPIGVIDSYIDRLVNLGHSVALVSQVEVVGNQKGMIGRKLERVITPGVRILSHSGSDKGENVLVAIYFDSEEEGAIAFSTLQSGKVFVKEHVSLARVGEEVRALSPSEVVVTRSGPIVRKLPHFPWAKSLSVKIRPDNFADVGGASRRELAKIEGYGSLGASSKRAVRLLLSYVDEATVDSSISIASIEVARISKTLTIDAATRANLEIVKNLRDGGVDGTLLSVVDRTATPSGARFLRGALLNPLTDVSEIQQRLDSVSFFKGERDSREVLRFELKGVGDLERIATRIELKSVTPRELGALRDALVVLGRIKIFSQYCAVPPLLLDLQRRVVVSPALTRESKLRWFVEVPPLSSQEGGIFSDGVHEEIDKLREIKRSGRSWIDELELKERTQSGIPSLKIKYNNVIGYYFEVTKTHLSKVPAHFIRRQSTVQGERFSTTELQQREEELMNAEGKLFALERSIFEEIRGALINYVRELRELSLAVGELDTLLSFGDVADKEDYSLPVITEGRSLLIEKGKHPVLATLLQGSIIPNSLSLVESGKRCMILTGPNMGGKSTYLRQAALIVILAQAGSFVPAERAEIGIVDKLFARIGASDNMVEGESTFMVEMREASLIVGNATDRSLILIDELGRGTATADGLALAHAIVEWLVTLVQARVLFATHYHELTDLEKEFPSVGNLSVGSADSEGEVVFTHQICEGPASKSYGLEVARLAGLPKNLIARARTFLSGYEAEAPVRKTAKGSSSQLSFFSEERTVVKEPPDLMKLRALRDKIRGLSPDDTTPREALGLLAALHKEVEETL